MNQPYKLNRFLILLAILLVIGFIIRLGADYYQYREGLSSLPFYYYILGRSILFLVPGILCVIGAAIIKRKYIS